MEGKGEKGAGRARRFLKRLLVSLLVLVVLIAVSTYIFIRSPYPGSLITYAVRRSTGMDLSMEALTLGPWLRVSLKGLELESNGKVLLKASRLDVRVEPSGISGGRVVSVSLGNPVIYLASLPAGAGGPASGGALAIPWFLKRVDVKDALIFKGSGEGVERPLAGPIGLSVRAISRSRAAFKARAYLPLLKTTASMGAELDMSALGIHGGRVSLGTLRLEDLGAGGVPLIRDGRGIIKPELRFQREDGALTASLRGDFTGVMFPGLPLKEPSGGRLTASVSLDRAFSNARIRAALFLKEPGSGRAAFRAALMTADYKIKTKDLLIKKAMLTMPSLGSLRLSGALGGVPGPEMRADLHLFIDELTLTVLNRTLLAPLSMEILDLKNGTGLSGSASMKGAVREGLAWQMNLTLGSPLRYGSYVLKLGSNPLHLVSHGLYSMGEDKLSIGDMRAGLGSVGGLSLKGEIRGLRSGNPILALALGGRGLDLGRARNALTGPLPEGLSVSGRAGAALSISGRTHALRVHGGLVLKGAKVSVMGIKLKGLGAELDLGYGGEGLRLGRMRLRVASTEMTAPGGASSPKGASGQGARPLIRLIGTDLEMESLSYADGTLRGGGLGININKVSLPMAWSGPVPQLLETRLSARSLVYGADGLKAGGLRAGVERVSFAGAGAKGGAKGEAPWSGPLPDILKSGLSIATLSYGKKGLRAGGIRVDIDKAVLERGHRVRTHGKKGQEAAPAGPLPRIYGTGLFIDSGTYLDGVFSARGLNLSVERALLIDKKRTLFEQRGISISGGLKGDIWKKTFIAKKLFFSIGQDSAYIDGESGGTSGEREEGGSLLRNMGGINGEAHGLSLDLNGPVKVLGRIRVYEVGVERLLPLVAGFTGAGKGLEASGTLETDLDVKAVLGPEESNLSAGVVMALRGGSFSTPDGEEAGEGIKAEIRGDISLKLPSLEAGFSLEAEAGGFELLAGSFYGSFKDNPIRLRARGIYNAEEDRLNLRDLTMALSPVGRVNVSGEIRSMGTAAPGLDLHVGPVVINNKGAYDLFIRDTFKEAIPMLRGLEVEGRTGLDLRVKGGLNDLVVSGDLTVKDGGVRDKEGKALVRDVDIHLPLKVRYPGEGKPRRGRGKGQKGFGLVRIGKVSWGPLETGAIEARPVIRDNTLRVERDVVIPVFGGSVTLKDIVFEDLLSPARELTLNVDVSGIDLKKAGSAIGLPPFEGEVSGSIPGVRLKGNKLTTGGEIKLSLFGGEVRLSRMSVGEVFSPVPSFKSSVEIRDLNLGALTGAFEFGTITGVLEGSVKDLVIVKGQPESFFADLHTVKRSGVSQRISTKALENVSILGTGAVASVLNRGIYRLFDEYRYSKMGFQAQLNNDELLLLGIETEGDKGYIIKGATFPPKVDVVSYTERISFKEMMRRIERVNLSGGGGDSGG